MSIVIRPGDGQPDSLKALLAAVRKHAGDEPVTVGSGGVVVSRAVAKKFLNARDGNDADTTGRTVDNTRAPLITHRTDGTVTGGPAGADLTVGGRTPEGQLPGGHAGTTPTPAVAGQAADAGDSPSAASGGAADGETATPAKKTLPAKKTTAAAQQRASRSTARSNP